MYLTIALFNLNGGYDPSTYVKLITTKYISKFVSAVFYDKNGNQLATVNRYEIPSDKKEDTFIDIDTTLGDNRLNVNVVNHYNALNQLTQTLTKNYKVSFTYDAERLRISKTVNREKTVYVRDGDQLVMELSDSGKVQKRYIRGNDLVYADKETDTVLLCQDLVQIKMRNFKVSWREIIAVSLCSI